MRPLDHDRVGVREPGSRREHRPRVADRDVVPEERAHPRDRGGEVDGAEDEHARLGGEGGDEDPHPLAAALAVRTVGERLGPPGREQTPGVVRHGVVGARRCQRPQRRRVGPDDEAPADPVGHRVLDDRADRDGPAGLDVRGDLAQLGERLAADTFSTKTSRIPPQVSPTAKASSSLMPYRWSTGSPEETTSCDSS